jgi:hypothetical protein
MSEGEQVGVSGGQRSPVGIDSRSASKGTASLKLSEACSIK